jgi:phospholipase C
MWNRTANQPPEGMPGTTSDQRLLPQSKRGCDDHASQIRQDRRGHGCHRRASQDRSGPECRTTADRASALDHVVVIMFENRSFDNVLGRLYAPGEVRSFEGVIGRDLKNPIPEWAEHGAERKVVPYGIAPNMNTPHPDPGEEYPHQNTDLFGILNPENRFKPLAKMVAPYNAPDDPRQQPTMDGFVMDYISAFTAEMGRQPTYDEYSQIMMGYTPEQMPVLSALARGFATFDHWFCEVPSQTFTNRSFFHAATASGYVINFPPADAFHVHNTAETLFERLEAKGLTWRVYCDAPSPLSFTGIIHASRLRSRFATNFSTVDDFLEDARNGEPGAENALDARQALGAEWQEIVKSGVHTCL